SAEAVLAAQAKARMVYLSDAVAGYVVAISRATRSHEALELGASPRATQALARAAQARAAIQGRAFVLPDDVKVLAGPVLAHRWIRRGRTRLRGRDTAALVSEIVAGVPVPVEAMGQKQN